MGYVRDYNPLEWPFDLSLNLNTCAAQHALGSQHVRETTKASEALYLGFG